MINLKKQKIITLSNSKAKKIVCIILAGILACILINSAFEGLFTIDKTVSPQYSNTIITRCLEKEFEVNQKFTPSAAGLSQITVTGMNDGPLEKRAIIYAAIVNSDGELIYEISREISAVSGPLKLVIPLRNIKLNAGEEYTLRFTGGMSFKENNFRFYLSDAVGQENGEAMVDGVLTDGGRTLQMSYRYTYFAVGVFALCSLFAILACLILAFYFRLSPIATMIYNLIVFISVPAITFCIVEWLNFGNPFEIWYVHVTLNLVWYYLVYIVLFALFNSLRASLVTGSILFFVCGLINHFTIMFRGTTVLPSDLLAATTALKVFEKYNFSLSRDLIFSFLLLLCIVQFAAKANFRIPKIKMRLATGAIIATFAVCFTMLYMNTGFLDSVGLTPYQWKQTKACKVRGLVANFTSNIPSLIVKKPAQYNVDEIPELLNTEKLENAGDISQLLNVNSAPDGKKPTVIAIMNESFSDLSYLGELTTNVDPLDYYHSLSENVIKGNVAVPVFGAGTSNSEFEFLTGNSVSFLPFGCVPYQQFVKADASSLVSTMNSQGYKSLAVHPYDPKGWAREKVYVDFGFEHFYSIDDFLYAEKQRWYVSDQAGYEKLIELYEQNDSGKPLFLFNVTMQNHGGYDYAPFSPSVTLEGYTAPYPEAEQYLSMIQKSDDAFEQLIAYFENVDEPTIICMFGDHLPKIEVDFYAELMGDKYTQGESLGDIYDTHVTPFIIWANYDLGVDVSDFGTISVNYLSSLMLHSAGLETTGYNDYLLNLMQELPIITSNGVFDRQGNFVDTADDESKHSDLLQDYQCLQYNNIIDVKKRDDSVFFTDRDN